VTLVRSTLQWLALTLLPATVFAAPDSHNEIAETIAAMYIAGPNTDISRESKIVAAYARTSETVDIVIDRRFLRLIDDEVDQSVRNELLAFYLAGAIIFDISNPELRSAERADVLPAYEMVLHRYSLLKARDPKLRIPFLDRAAFHQAKRTLAEFIDAPRPSPVD